MIYHSIGYEWDSTVPFSSIPTKTKLRERRTGVETSLLVKRCQISLPQWILPLLRVLERPKAKERAHPSTDVSWSESDRAWEDRLTEWQIATAHSQSSFYWRKRLFFAVSSYLTIIYFQVRNFLGRNSRVINACCAPFRDFNFCLPCSTNLFFEIIIQIYKINIVLPRNKDPLCAYSLMKRVLKLHAIAWPIIISLILCASLA